MPKRFLQAAVTPAAAWSFILATDTKKSVFSY